VGLAPATKPAARASDVSFRMLHRECGTPIKQKRWCPVHERDLGPDEIGDEALIGSGGSGGSRGRGGSRGGGFLLKKKKK
jgi:hypothetical protein